MTAIFRMILDKYSPDEVLVVNYIFTTVFRIIVICLKICTINKEAVFFIKNYRFFFTITIRYDIILVLRKQKGENEMGKTKGGFTLPGESGYEKLTLEMAEKWGADVIRDSDGTELSPEIINAGYGIYSTICIIRDHNEWAKQNTDKLQQSFLMTKSCCCGKRQC